MTQSLPIQPGTVEWSGDNSGIYLKASADGPYLSRASLFRVVVSPHGSGHALVLIEGSGQGDGLNLCLHDNAPLARWLVDEYLGYFQQFRGLETVGGLKYLPLDETQSRSNGTGERIEVARAPNLEVRLAWRGLGTPFMVTLPPERSATGRHTMYSVFVDAAEADITVNGRKLAGATQPRDYHGRPSTTSFLAFSETWVLG